MSEVPKIACHPDRFQPQRIDKRRFRTLPHTSDRPRNPALAKKCRFFCLRSGPGVMWISCPGSTTLMRCNSPFGKLHAWPGPGSTGADGIVSKTTRIRPKTTTRISSPSDVLRLRDLYTKSARPARGRRSIVTLYDSQREQDRDQAYARLKREAARAI
jgi:hypothetical protein